MRRVTNRTAQEAQKGDPSAWLDIIDYIGKTVNRLGWFLTPDVREDFTQDASIRMVHSLTRFRPEKSSFATYVGTETYYSFLRSLKDSRKNPTQEIQFDPSARQDIFTRVLAREYLYILSEVIHDMDSAHQDILTSSAPLTWLASRYNTSVSAVKSARHRVRKKTSMSMRKQLKGEGYHEFVSFLKR